MTAQIIARCWNRSLKRTTSNRAGAQMKRAGLVVGRGVWIETSANQPLVNLSGWFVVKQEIKIEAPDLER